MDFRVEAYDKWGGPRLPADPLCAGYATQIAKDGTARGHGQQAPCVTPPPQPRHLEGHLPSASMRELVSRRSDRAPDFFAYAQRSWGMSAEFGTASLTWQLLELAYE